MTTSRHFRESPRLCHFDYTGNHVYNLGIRTRSHLPRLSNASAAPVCVKALAESCKKHSFECLAYCFMPDHAHLLVASREGVSLKSFLGHFKQLTGWRYKQTTGDHLWQISYYDHVLRVEEAIEQVSDYIWMNPVRAGLVEGALDYAHSGPRENMLL